MKFSTEKYIPVFYFEDGILDRNDQHSYVWDDTAATIPLALANWDSKALL